jgi:hypothetical protein
MIIHIDMNEDMPSYLQNWVKYYKMDGRYWKEVISKFEETTHGKMCGIFGDRKFTLVFDNDHDGTYFLLRWL